MAGADFSGLQNVWQDPWFQAGIGMLGSNVGGSGDQAFRNALQGGMGGLLRGQTMVGDIQRQQAQTEALRQQQEQRARQMEQQRRLAAAAPQLATGLLSDDPDLQRQAATGLLGMAPELLPQMAVGMLGQQPEQEPTSLMRHLEAAGFTPGTEAYQQAMLGAVMKPQTQINMGPDLPTNYQWVDPQDKTKGVQPIPGSPAEKETRKQEFKLGGVRSALDRYRKSLKKHGAEIVPGAAKSELQTAYFDLMMEMKELFNLGVLQGPDLEIMQQTLTNPVTMQGKWLETTGGIEAFEGQLRLVEQKLDEARDRARALTGPRARTAQSPPPPPPGFVRQ